MTSEKIINYSIKFARYSSLVFLALPAAFFGAIPIASVSFSYTVHGCVPFSEGKQAGLPEFLGYLDDRTLLYLENLQVSQPWILLALIIVSGLIGLAIVGWWYTLMKILKSISCRNFFIAENTFYLEILGISALLVPVLEYITQTVIRLTVMQGYTLSFHKGLLWLGICCLLLSYMNRQGVQLHQEAELTV
jgi:hypothetical protein